MSRSLKFLGPVAIWMLFLTSRAMLHAQPGPQPPLCSANAAVTPALRAESYADRTGDITITCVGGTALTAGAALPTVNISVFLNTSITSRTYANGWSEALLIVDEAGSGMAGTTNTQLVCNDPNGICPMTSTGGTAATYDGSTGRPNIFPGVVNSNVVTFYAVPIDPPAVQDAFLVLRIMNIRVNASTLAPGSGAPAPVIAQISTSNPDILPVSNSQPIVGFVQSGLAFSLRLPDNSGTSGGTAVIPCAAAPQRAGILRFAERYGTVTAPRTAASFVDSDHSPAPLIQNVPGVVNNSESGLYNPTLTAPTVDFANAGLADFGTRFKASFSGVPSGTNIYVSATGVTFSNGSPSASTTGTVARLTQSEVLPFAAIAPTTTLEGIPAVQIPVVGGSATAVWEVLGSNPNTMENFDFAVWAQVGGTAGLTTAVNGSFAPTPPGFSAGDGAQASSTLPLPRFLPDPNPAQNVFQSGICSSITTPILVSGTPDYGNQLTFAATVGPAIPPPADTVTFFDGTATVGTANVDSAGTATVTTTTFLSAGTHSITARFNGDSNLSAVTSSALTVVIGGASVNVSVTSPTVAAGQSVAFGTPIVVSATFAAAPQQPAIRAARLKRFAGAETAGAGTATFTDSSGVSCQSAITNNVATCTLNLSTAGSHTVTVTSDANYVLVGQNTFTFSIAKAVSSTSLAASTYTPTVGQTVVLTATVNGGGATPHGTVGFSTAAGVLGSCGTVALVNLTATCATSFPAAGAIYVDAKYSGDDDTTPSEGGITENVVNGPPPPTTSVTIWVSQNPAVVGQSLTVTASVSTSNAEVPTGSVQFNDGATALGTVPLAGGQASVTITFTTAGSHTLYARYSGDRGFPGSSSLYGILVIRAATSLALTTNPGTSVFGQAVILTAALAANSRGLPAPSGQIQFFDGTALLGAAALASGGASITLSNLIPGTHQLKATYGGDSTWNTSTSAAVIQAVAKAPTVTTLTSSSGAMQATLSSVVSPMSSVSAIPTGTVQYVDATTNEALATGDLAGGKSTATIGAACRMIQAIYPGDANFQGSRSTPAAQLWIGNAASFTSSRFAANEIVTLKGMNLSAGAVTVVDSVASGHTVTPSYTSSGQIDFVLPARLPLGPATVTVANRDGSSLSISIGVAAIAPGIFPAPALVNAGGALYLEIYGTGFDAAGQVTVTVNGQSVPVLFAGPHPQFAGLDQVNAGPLPATLLGAGTVDVVVKIDGQPANSVTVTIVG